MLEPEFRPIDKTAAPHSIESIHSSNISAPCETENPVEDTESPRDKDRSAEAGSSEKSRYASTPLLPPHGSASLPEVGTSLNLTPPPPPAGPGQFERSAPPHPPNPHRCARGPNRLPAPVTASQDRANKRRLPPSPVFHSPRPT